MTNLTGMEERERALKDIQKLEHRIVEFKKLDLVEKYKEVFEYVENYYADAKHFYSEGKFFTAFGAANYAYGFIDAVLIIEGKLEAEEEERVEGNESG